MDNLGCETLPSTIDLYRMLPFPDRESLTAGNRACKTIPDSIEILLTKLLGYTSKEEAVRVLVHIGRLAIDNGDVGGSFLPVADVMADDYMCFTGWLKGSIDPANGIAHFMSLVAELLKRSTCNQHPPKRLIIPLHYMGKRGNVTNLALDMVNPKENWRDYNVLGVGGSGIKSLSVEKFHSLLGCVSATASQYMMDNFFLRATYIMNHAQIEGSQFNRRYSWGMMVADTTVTVRVVGIAFKITSHVMDLATPRGRQDFIEFVIRWSYSDLQHLGFDPTMVYLKNLGCWEITVHDKDENGEVRPRVVYGYESFAIHKRITLDSFAMNIVGRSTKPALLPDGTAPKYKPEENDVMIKDSWEDPERPCNEIRTLRAVTAVLSKKKKTIKKFRGMYPEIVAGGAVVIDGKEDTVQNIVGKQQWHKHVVQQSSRVHRRMVTKGVGQLLSGSRCTKEEEALIKRDIKLFNEQIGRSCGIMHRHASRAGNILVRRNSKDGKVKGGMLINFDEIVFIRK